MRGGVGNRKNEKGGEEGQGIRQYYLLFVLVQNIQLVKNT